MPSTVEKPARGGRFMCGFALRHSVLPLLLFVAVAAIAAPDEDDAAVNLPPTFVRALRIESTKSAVSSPVEVLDEEEIRLRNTDTLGGLLDGLTGLMIHRYGVFGALENLAVNGAPSAEVVIIQDGVRLNSPQNGATDLSLWDGSDLSRVEVASGGYSALYGADAMAGIVLLETPPVPSVPGISIETRAGSFGRRGAKIMTTAPLGSRGVRLEFARDLATNDFPYEWRGEPRRRWNSATQRNRFRLQWNLPVPTGQWTLAAQGVQKSNGIPGPETGARPDDSTPRPRLWDREGYVSLHGVAPAGAWRVETTLSAHGTFQRYTDPSLRIDSRHRTRAFAAHVQGSRFIGGTRLVAGLDANAAIIRSTTMKDASREYGGLFLMAIRSFQLPRRWPIDEVQADAALRGDAYSDFGSAVSPRGGLVLRRGAFRLYSNVSRNFSAPTFNDLYWQPGGNPGLKPERGTYVTIGARWNREGISVEANHARARFRNQIRWLPDSSGLWSPKNALRTDLTGWAGRVKLSRGPLRWTLRASHTDVIRADGTRETNRAYGKQAPFEPQNLLSAELGLRVGSVLASVSHRWVGKTFTRADNRDSLPGYAVTDLAFRATRSSRGVDYEARFRVNNLWNRTYHVLPQYPLPGRSFEVTLGARL